MSRLYCYYCIAASLAASTASGHAEVQEQAGSQSHAVPPSALATQPAVHDRRGPSSASTAAPGRSIALDG